MAQRLVPAVFFLALAVFSSCASHYIAPAPLVPQLEKAGDLDVTAGTLNQRTHLQLSFSPIRHIGLSYGFRGRLVPTHNDRSQVHSMNLQFYLPITKEKTAFWYVNSGYDKGDALSARKEISLSSAFQTRRISSGLYEHFSSSLTVGYDVTWQRIAFSSLYTQESGRPGYMLAAPANYSLYTHTLHFTHTPSAGENTSDRFSFYLRYSIAANFTQRAALPMQQVSPPPNFVSNEHQIHPQIDKFVFSFALGLRFNAYGNLFQKKEP